MFSRFTVSDDIRDWVLENFSWAIDNDILTSETVIILPTSTNFPTTKGDHYLVARGLVDSIARHLNISSAGIDVVPLDVLPAEYQLDYNALSDVGGTWSADGAYDGKALVRYNPNLAQTPIAFLSMLVHEMMHHRLHMTALDFPGGAGAEELATDLHCITAGFGVIEMSGADRLGWQGYMRQETRAFALAVFCAVKGLDVNETSDQLSNRAGRMLKRAAKFVAQIEQSLPTIQ